MDTCYTYFRAKAFELPKRLVTCYFSRYSQAGVHNVRLLTKEMIPQAWRWVAACIPYTWGAHAFIHVNSMGATFSQVTREFIALWVLTGAYGVMACVLFYIRKERGALRQKKEC